MAVHINWPGTKTAVTARLMEWGRSVGNPAIDRARRYLLDEVDAVTTNGVQVVADVPEPGEETGSTLAVKPLDLIIK